MEKIYITQDVAKEAKELLEKEYTVVIGKNLTEDELCEIIGEYDGIITRSQTRITKKVILDFLITYFQILSRCRY